MLPTITVDIGTTSIKLCLFDADGQLAASGRRSTPTTTDAYGEIYDIHALRGAVVEFIAHLEPSQRRTAQRIAITGVGESGGLVRPDLSLASPMILWHDHRGAKHLEGLSPQDRSLIYRVTGLPVNANYSLSKVAWAVERAERITGAQWLNVAEYVAALMTGERWSEPSLASRTMALDIATGEWSPQVCELLGLDVDRFPQLRPAREGATVTPSFATEAGLASEVRVHVAGHDHMVGGVGAGLGARELLNSTGTTEGLLYLRRSPTIDKRAERSKLANGRACAGEGFTLFASIPTGGSAFATLQSMLGVDPERLSACITDLHERYVSDRIDLGAIPLVLPQFRGSPPPEKNARARGAMAGIRTDTTLEDIVFGCFLGMVLQFRDVLELFRGRADNIKVIGPGSSNPLWLQLKADLLGTPLSASAFPEVVSLGAQALASNVSGSWEATKPREVPVDDGRHERLGDWYAEVRPQWEHLKGFPS